MDSSVQLHAPTTTLLYMWQFIAEANAQGLMALTAPATTQAPLSDPSIGTQHRHSPLGHSTARRPGPSSLPPSHDGKERNPPPPFSRRAASSVHPSSSIQTDRQSICPVPLCFLHTVPPRSQAAATPAHPSLPPCPPLKAVTRAPARALSRSTNQRDRQTHTHPSPSSPGSAPRPALQLPCVVVCPAACTSHHTKDARACVRTCTHT